MPDQDRDQIQNLNLKKYFKNKINYNSLMGQIWKGNLDLDYYLHTFALTNLHLILDTYYKKKNLKERLEIVYPTGCRYRTR